jgi:hypothetical protein
MKLFLWNSFERSAKNDDKIKYSVISFFLGGGWSVWEIMKNFDVCVDPYRWMQVTDYGRRGFMQEHKHNDECEFEEEI